MLNSLSFMINSWLWILLPVKHGLLAHTWDIGYSGCRTGDNRTAWSSLFKHLFSELLVTAFLLYGHSLEHYLTAMMTEGSALLTAMFIDRRTWFSKAVRIQLALLVHVFIELCLLAFYVYLGWILSEPPVFVW